MPGRMMRKELVLLANIFLCAVLLINCTLVSAQSTILCNGRNGRNGLPGVTGPPGREGKPGERGRLGGDGIVGLPGPPGPRTLGVTYTRWGKTTCPSTPGTQLVYAGRTGGSWYSYTGGGANYLCMPENPEYSRYVPGVQASSPIFGTEYQTNEAVLPESNDRNVPCAVCDASTRGRVLMIPARLTCPDTWTREYNGYLMSTYHASNHYRTMHECVDGDPDTVPGLDDSTDGAVFYHTEANCNGMPCPAYNPEKELTCVVCTK